MANMQQKKHNSRQWLWAGAVGIALAFLLMLMLLAPKQQYLILRNADSGQIMYHAPLAEGEIFSVSYTHSVNKSNVEEFYLLRGEDIYLTKLVYATFGAGMTTDAAAESGTVFFYDEQGRMVIEGYDRLITGMIYHVAATADHILHIKGGLIHLTAIAPPTEALRFEIRAYKSWQAWLL